MRKDRCYSQQAGSLISGNRGSRGFVKAFIVLLCVVPFTPVAAVQPSPAYEPGVVVVQFDSLTQITGKSSRIGVAAFDRIATKYDVHTIERVYPFLDYVTPTPKTCENLLALRRTYYVRYHGKQAPIEVAGRFDRVSGVVYAEPVAVNRLYSLEQMEMVDPNDPLFASQTEQHQLRLSEAWNEVKSQSGSPKVVIAIVDNGGEWRHQDLRANVWTNEDEIPDNQIDDDLNGYIDDIHGLNLSNEDETNHDPTRQPELGGNKWHGTAVAGAASAVSDNGIGIAGTSWNASLMHINASDPAGLGVPNGYEGILYAAANGADIINTSWGGFVPENKRLQLIDQTLNLATDLGALIVSAAGNSRVSNDFHPFYPARHPRVLSVGATEKESIKHASFSHYGKLVDVFAPGVEIVTTGIGGEYIRAQGTSLSSPLVAGVAALVKTKFPEMTPDALREKIRFSAESMDLANVMFAGQLGRGFVNALAAVQQTDDAGVALTRWSWEDDDRDDAIATGDEVVINAVFTNHLSDARGLSIGLQGVEPYPFLQMVQGEVDIGFLGGGESSDVTFRFRIAPDAPLNRQVRFYVNVLVADSEDISDMLSFRLNRSLEVVHQSLSALYTATGGMQWHRDTNWDIANMPDEAELQTWHGVTMSEGWIHRLELFHNNLTGSLPPGIGGLSEVRHLDFSFNSISGSVPGGFKQFSELRRLILSDNAFSGTIPSEFGDLAKLEWLLLNDNSFSGSVPSVLGNLLHLEELFLNNNELAGSIPSELGNLSELLSIDLGENTLTGLIPPELGNLSNLEWMNFGANALTGFIPSELGNLANLKFLDLGGNTLTGLISPEFSRLSQLRSLNLSGNSLSGEVPSGFGNLSLLDSLKLSNNALVGRLPRSLLKLDSLKVFWFDGQDLCAPQDQEFQDWLEGIADVRGDLCEILELAGDIEDQIYIQAKPIAPLILPKATGGIAPITYSLTPALPKGLEFNSSIRTISGTPTSITSSPVAYTFKATDIFGSSDSLQFEIRVDSPGPIESEIFPETFTILGNYPNPFQAETRLAFDLPGDAKIKVEVMDIIGRRLLLLPEMDITGGWSKTIEFNGESLPAGHYLYRLIADLPMGRSVRVGSFVRVR